MTPTVSYPVKNMTLPGEGPRTIPADLDMAATLNYEIDISQLVGNGIVSFISGVWADNSANGQDVTLICSGTNQRVIIGANSQGWYPLAVSNPPVFEVSQSALGGVLRLTFVNFPVFPFSNDKGANLQQLNGSPFADVALPGVMPVSNMPRACTTYTLTLTGNLDDILIPAGNIFSFVCFRGDSGNSAPALIGMDGAAVGPGSLDINAGGTWVFSGLAISNAITAGGAPGDILYAFAV